MPNLVPLAVVTAASAATAVLGARANRKVMPLVASLALAFGGALWHVRSQEIGLWFSAEHHFLATLIAAAIPPVLVGLTVLLPLGGRLVVRGLVAFGAGLGLVAGWPAILDLVETLL